MNIRDWREVVKRSGLQLRIQAEVGLAAEGWYILAKRRLDGTPYPVFEFLSTQRGQIRTWKRLDVLVKHLQEAGFHGVLLLDDYTVREPRSLERHRNQFVECSKWMIGKWVEFASTKKSLRSAAIDVKHIEGGWTASTRGVREELEKTTIPITTRRGNVRVWKRLDVMIKHLREAGCFGTIALHIEVNGVS